MDSELGLSKFYLVFGRKNTFYLCHGQDSNSNSNCFDRARPSGLGWVSDTKNTDNNKKEWVLIEAARHITTWWSLNNKKPTLQSVWRVSNILSFVGYLNSKIRVWCKQSVADDEWAIMSVQFLYPCSHSATWTWDFYLKCIFTWGLSQTAKDNKC